MKTIKQILEEDFSIDENTVAHNYAYLYRSMMRAAEIYASQFAYDFSKTCECKNSPGETWCCNHCGLPVTKKK